MNCPNCQSNKIKVVIRAWAIVFWTGALISWIPIIGWLFGPLLMISSPFVYLMERGKRTVQCNECKTRFYIAKDEMHEWQVEIQGNLKK